MNMEGSCCILCDFINISDVTVFSNGASAELRAIIEVSIICSDIITCLNLYLRFSYFENLMWNTLHII